MGLAGVKLTLIDSHEDVLDMRAWLGEQREWLGVDVETSGLNLGRDRVRLCQIGDRDHGWAAATGEWGWGAAVAEAIGDYRGRIAMHNTIYDSGLLKRDGFTVPQAQVHDTMVMAQLVMSHLPIGLKPVAKRLVDRRAVDGQRVLDEAMKRQGWTWGTVPIDYPGYWQYGALDPVLTCRIAEKLWPKVQERYREPYEVELGAIHVLRDAELAGMKVDVEYAKHQSELLGAEMEGLMPKLPCNPNSQPQVEEFLQSRGAQLIKRTDSGKGWSTDDEVLAYFEATIPECAPMRRYRECSKLKSSYFDNLLELQTSEVVHPSIRVLGAQKTGRMSISAPALQTLPKSEIGRNAFIARDGQAFISADYKGMEMRLMAHEAEEQKLIELFLQGIDTHDWTATELYGEGWTTKQRNIVKNAAFAKIYGAGIPKFATTAGISVGEAEAFLMRYDQLFPGVASYMDQVVDAVRESHPNDKRWGEINTWLGRRLFVSKDEAYKGVNYTIQGGCSEITKLKLCELDAAGLGQFIRLPIHDEILFEVPDELVPEVGATIHEVMPERGMFKVPFEIDMETCRRWGELYAA